MKSDNNIRQSVLCFFGSHKWLDIKPVDGYLKTVCSHCGSPMACHPAVYEQMCYTYKHSKNI